MRLGFTLALVSAMAVAQVPDPSLAREILKEMVEIDTTAEHGDTTPLAELLAKRFVAAGFPEADVQVLGPHPKNKNLVLRWRSGSIAKPILLLDHLDVVEARRSDWSVDPFKLTEQDGYLYGRGTQDIKGEAAIQVATLIKLKREGFRPSRDLILALTAGEEGSGDYDGAAWLMKERRELIDAEYCLNGDGGITQSKKGRPYLRAFQTSEKASIAFELEVRNPGGHSSLPTKENAILRLAEGLARLRKLRFPLNLDETRRAFLLRTADLEQGQRAADLRAVAATGDPAAEARLSEDPYLNAQMHTTCVPTLLNGGHAVNALPQSAKATLNARVLPGESVPGIQAAIVEALADPQITVTLKSHPGPNPASPLRSDLLQVLERTTSQVWPGVPVAPSMDTGGSDGSELRPAGIPTYGVSGIPFDDDDIRAHGRDERVRIKSFGEGLQAFELMLRELAGPGK